MKFSAIVLSGGSGKRMGADRPKQYLDLAGYPVIYYSLKAFEESPVDQVVLVAGKDDLSYCREEIVERYGFSKVTHIVAGGAERYDSVYQGLCAIEDEKDAYVLIHDGARPLIAKDTIIKLMETVQKEKACVTAVPVKDTIKIADEKFFARKTPDRRFLWSVQTPQVFSYSLVKEAYDCIYTDANTGISITDDAMVVETFTKHPVKLVEGKYTNIKVTTPEDLIFAEAMLASGKI